MKTEIAPKWFMHVCSDLLASNAKSAIKYIDEKTIVRATWRHKPNNKHTREEMVVTFGRPNYLERKFVKLCKRAKEPFPVLKVQLKPWPIKRKK